MGVCIEGWDHMHEDVRASRERISRRRALALGGTVGLSAILAACTGDGTVQRAASSPTRTASVDTAVDATSGTVLDLLNRASTCSMAVEQTQGPFWFDVDSIRRDIREDRPGAPLQLALRVHDVSGCSSGGDVVPVRNAVVEIWHCDAGGVYSGFGSSPDDGTYLRGAQVTDADGIVRFTTIYPGWYPGRTVHIHLKVHVDNTTVLTSQVYMEESVSRAVFATSPYNHHQGRDTDNAGDFLYDSAGLLTMRRTDEGYLGVINLGVDV